MNVLFQMTRVNIIERQAFRNGCVFDDYILNAVEAYDRGTSSKTKGSEFFKAIIPIWKMYEKENYSLIFSEFMEMELELEAITQDHSSHINHVIQEFLFGYNILTNCRWILDTYNFSTGKDNKNSEFCELLFSWMIAALFHDIGYDVEKAPYEEAYRKKKNEFWDFMTKRALTSDPLSFSIIGNAKEIINEIIIPEINRVLENITISNSDFDKLFISKSDIYPGWSKYDHGVISAIKYLSELKKLERTSDLDYTNWEPNKNAALAMIFHNFRYKNLDLGLSCQKKSTLISYLLMVCDETQEWERERLDSDEYDVEGIEGKNLKKSTELIGISFKENRAYIIINHILKSPLKHEEFEEYMDKKIILQREHYPIRVLFPNFFRANEKDEFINNVEKIGTIIATNLLLNVISPSSIISSSFVELVPTVKAISAISKIVGRLTPRQKRILKIVNTVCKKKLLIPSNPEPIYEVFIDHRIDNVSYLTTIFPM